MNVYATESIRNVVLLGHGGCGKTSLIESMAFTTGIIKRVRTVTEGGTVSDYDKEEVKRKFSIQSSVIPLEVDGVDRKSTRLNSSHVSESRMPSSA